MASLVTIDGTSFELAEAETVLGRGGRDLNDPPKVDVGPLPGGATVSHRHARVFFHSGQWCLRVEAPARNPTLVGGRRIPGGEETALSDNTRIQLGDVVLTFKASVLVPAFNPDATMAEVSEEAPPVPAVVPIIVPEPPPAPVTAAAPPPVVVPEAQSPVGPPVAKAAQVVAAPPAEWPARLPGRPAAIDALGVSEFKRVNPFRGLMIDEEAWADAHDYHRAQMRLHLLSGHGWGIVEGLEVLADAQAPNTIIIRSGVAVDSQGRALLVPRDRRLSVTADPGTSLYVALRLREELAAPQRFWNDLDEYTRVVESCEALVQRTPPTPPALELARVRVESVVRNAPDLTNPQPGEIDLRFRERLMVRPRPDISVAQLVLSEGETDDAASAHRQGLRYLLREIGLTTPYRARWAGAFRRGDLLPPATVLYAAGLGRFTLSDEVINRLRDFCQGGGVLFMDGCQAGKPAEFASAVEVLAGALGCSLQAVGRGHSVLSARHLFAEPPLGDKGARLAEGGGLVLSTADYGCAWRGGPPDRPLSRELIRAALELGVNVAVYARQRQRPLEVVDLEA